MVVLIKKPLLSFMVLGSKCKHISLFRAMYDYEAQDEDEVSFQDGDLIINVSSIDRGWMTGEVRRTGQVGMLPANYVELANHI